MKLRSKVSLAVGVLWLGLSVPGCGGGQPADTGPVEEPNVGPGGPPGIGLTKGGGGPAKGDTKAASAPSAKDAAKK